MKNLLFPLLNFFVLMNLALHVQGQEQITDINFRGVTSPTDISGTVGFATYNGDHYMIQEKDSVLIYKFQNNDFVLHSLIPSEDPKIRVPRTIVPNRSLFEIREQFYYRFLYDGLEIIDLEQGEIASRFDFSSDQITNISPIEIHENSLFFYGNFESQRNTYKLSFETNQLELIPPRENRSNEIQYASKVFGIEDEHKVFMYDIETEKDSLIYNSQEAIFTNSFSTQDSNFYFVEQNGAIWKINNDLELQHFDCVILNFDKLISLKIRGNTVIAIYEHIGGENPQYKVDIFDLLTCQTTLTFITDPTEYYTSGIQYVENEDIHSDFTIFGFYGFNPTDGFNQGLYYVIDHNQNTYTPFKSVSNIQSFTPFEFNNSLYFVSIHSSYWGSYEYLYTYDVITKNIMKLDPNLDFKTRFTALGYPINGELKMCINTSDEEPTIWSLQEDFNFEKLQTLDFLFNLGINYVSNISQQSNRIYFTSNGGIYSILDDSRDEFLFPIQGNIHGSSYNIPNATYDNIFAIAEPNIEKIKFLRLNTESSTLDSLIDENVKSSSIMPSAGPFIFYSKGNSEDTLQIYDAKTNSIINYPDLPYLISAWLFEGKDKASFIFRDDDPLYQIDYSTNTITQFDLDFFGDVKVVAGSKNSFYIIEQEYQTNRTRIRIVKDNGDVELLYEGADRFYSKWYQTGTSDNPMNFLCLASNGESIKIIANDTENTEIIELNHDYLSGNFSPLILYQNGNLLIRTNEDNMGDQYWVYNDLNSLKEIQLPEYDRFWYSDFSENMLYVITQKNTNLSLLKYNIDSNLSTVTSIGNVCEQFNLRDGIAINNSEYLFNIRCTNGYEPWRLAIDESNFYPYEEIYPGFLSSFPSNFINHENWIYFTAITGDNSNQWFRIQSQGPNSIIEWIEPIANTLKIYPSPSSNCINIDEDLSQVSVYSMDGRLVSSLKSYNKNEPINISSLLSGNYLIKAKTKVNQIKSGKFTKIK